MQIPIVKGKQLNMLVHMVDTKDKVEKQTQPLQLSPTGGKKECKSYSVFTKSLASSQK
jgi:hypothetical protein